MNSLRNVSSLGTHGETLWYKKGSLLLNGTLPSYISDFANQRYYTSTAGPRSFPYTLTRTSNGMQFDSSGRLIWAKANMLLHSDDLTNAAWTKTDSTITADTETAPSGALADLITEGVAGTALVQQAVASMPAYAHFVYSVELKRGNHDWVRVYFGTGAGNVQAWFNLATGTLGTVTPTGSPVQLLTPFITDLGGGWYRCVVSVGNINMTSVTMLTVSAASDGSTTRVNNATRTEGRHQFEMYGIDAPKLPMTQTTTAAFYEAKRFDYNPSDLASLGLLIEESRTNSIPNSWANGAAIGTTPPTNWAFVAGSGISIDITAVGFEDGMPYMDVRFAGTASAGVTISLQFNASTSVAAAVSQNWAGSVFCRRAPSATNDGRNFFMGLLQRDAGGAALSSVGSVSLESGLSATSIGKNRATTTAAMADAATAFVCLRITKTYVASDVANDTIRVALPQLEGTNKQSASSPIPTYNTATVTRAQETFSSETSLSSFFPSGHTVYIDYRTIGQSPSFPAVFCIGDGVASSDEHTMFESASLNPTIEIKDASVLVNTSTALGAITARSRQKIASVVGTGANANKTVRNGGAVTSKTPTSFPVFDRMSLGNFNARGGSTTAANGVWIDEIRIYPAASPSDAQLQTLTT